MSLLFSWWVAAVLCCISLFLITFISLPLRLWVSIMPSCLSNLLICLSLALQRVSSCYALQHLKLLDNICSCSLLFRGFVIVVPHCILTLLIVLVLHSLESKWFSIACNISGLLMIPLLDASVGEWVLCLISKPPDDTCLLFSRGSVIDVPYSILSPLSLLVFGLPVGEWLPCPLHVSSPLTIPLSIPQFVSCWHGCCIIAALMNPVLGLLCILLSTSL